MAGSGLWGQCGRPAIALRNHVPLLGAKRVDLYRLRQPGLIEPDSQRCIIAFILFQQAFVEHLPVAQMVEFGLGFSQRGKSLLMLVAVDQVLPRERVVTETDL